MTHRQAAGLDGPFHRLESIDLFLEKCAAGAQPAERILETLAFGHILMACDALFTDLLKALDAVDRLGWNAPSRMLGVFPLPARWHCGRAARQLRTEWQDYFNEGALRLLQADAAINVNEELAYCIAFGERLCHLRLEQMSRRWLRLGVQFRRLVGMVGLRKRTFRMAYEIAQATVDDFEAWKWEWRAGTWMNGTGAQIPASWLDANPSPAMLKTGIYYTEIQRIVSDYPSQRLILSQALSEVLVGAHRKRWRERGDRPRVSIVLPTYNRAFVIAQAIESIREQTWPHWELWVCDDGSTDNTREVVASFEDERIHYLPLSRGGAAKARNAGLQEARGSVIAYLDSDNLWHPAYLEVMLNYLAEAKHPGPFYGSFLDLRLQEDRIIDVCKPLPRPFSYERLSTGNYIDLNFFAHATALNRLLGGFAPALKKRQDWDLALKYAFRHDARPASLSLGIYRRNEAWDQITEKRHLTAEANQIIYGHLDAYYHSGVLHDVVQEPRLGVVIASDNARAQAEAERALRAWRTFAKQPALIFGPDDAMRDVETVYWPSKGLLEIPQLVDARNKAADTTMAPLAIPVRPLEPDRQAREALRARFGFKAEDQVILVSLSVQGQADTYSVAQWLNYQGYKTLIWSEQGRIDEQGEPVPERGDHDVAEAAVVCDVALLHLHSDDTALPPVVPWLCAHAVPMASAPHPLAMPFYRERALVLYDGADPSARVEVLAGLLNKPVGKACGDAAYRYYLRHFSERAWYESVLLAVACSRHHRT